MKGVFSRVTYKSFSILMAIFFMVSMVQIPVLSVNATEPVATVTDAEGDEAEVATEPVATSTDADSDEAEVATTASEDTYDFSDEGLLISSDSTSPIVTYSVHAQTYGWMQPVSNGAMSGTKGQSKRLEAICIAIDTNGILNDRGEPVTGGIRYRTHVQGTGWQDWIYSEADGESVTMQIDKFNYAGTSGQSKRLEAIEIELTGELAEKYDILYRTHIQSIGWQSVVSNGATSGTIGASKRLEAIEIVIVEKNQEVSATLSYSVHGQSYGWTNTITVAPGQVNSGTIAGKTGQSKRLEAITINIDTEGVPGGVEYKAHVQGIGWQSLVSDGAISGTVGKSKRLEAITIDLTGPIASYYDIYYRVHVQNLGWLGWAKNGAKAGTQGISRRIEAVQITLIKKGEGAPGSTSNPFYNCSGVDGWKNIPGELWIKVNKQMNCITFYKGDIPFKAVVCSTGAATPVGTFNLKSKWRWKELIHEVYGQYSTHITGNILFHSVPYDDPNIYTLLTGSYNQLGEQVSAGCIRLTTEDAKWIYDNCPTGTRVVIYNSPDPGPLGKPTAQKLPYWQTWDPTDPLIN